MMLKENDVNNHIGYVLYQRACGLYTYMTYTAVPGENTETK